MQERSQVDRKVGAGSVIVGAAIAALVVGGAAAIAGSGVERAPVASVKTQIKKLSKKVAKATKKANQALEVAERTSKSQGPQGPQGLQGQQGQQGEPGSAGAPGLIPISRGIDAATVSTSSAVVVDLGGPSATVTVGPSGGFVQLMATAEINIGADAGTTCTGVISSASLLVPFFAISQTGTANTFVRTASSTPAVRFLPQGAHTFRFDYQRQAGTSACQFRDRQLFVALLQ